jgi:hypothetical protein
MMHPVKNMYDAFMYNLRCGVLHTSNIEHRTLPKLFFSWEAGNHCVVKE